MLIAFFPGKSSTKREWNRKPGITSKMCSSAQIIASVPLLVIPGTDAHAMYDNVRGPTADSHRGLEGLASIPARLCVGLATSPH